MGDRAGTADKVWTAEEFLRTDEREFGDAWRYELVDGRIVSPTLLRRLLTARLWPRPAER